MKFIYGLDLFSNLTIISSLDDYVKKLSDVISPDNDFCFEWVCKSVKNNIRNSGWKVHFSYNKSSPGVYCVYRIDMSKKENVLLYIGCSRDISKRIKNKKHPYQANIKFNDSESFIYVKVKETNEYEALEKRLIKKLKPILNIKYV